MADDYPKQRSDISIRVIEGETVVLHLSAGQIHRLNPTASFIWDRCDGHRTAAEIADELTELFDVDYETAREAVRTTLRQLAGLGLLDGA
jgi:hypothetical protein